MRASLIFSLLLSGVSATPTSYPTNPLLPTRLVYQSKNATFFENIFPRSNGHLLLTSASEPSLYTIDPVSKNPLPYLVSSFPDINGSGGITEVSPNVFVVQGAIFNLTTFRCIPDSTRVFKVDLRGKAAKTTVVAKIPGDVTPNGLTAIPGSPDLVLSADSFGGKVWRVNIKTGEVSVAIQDENMTPIGPDALPFGVNGVHVRNSNLFYSSSTRNLYCRVPINSKGEATGPIKVIAKVPGTTEETIDDFALDTKGNAYMTQHTSQKVYKITPDGRQSVVLSPNSTVAPQEPTSGSFGRGSKKQEKTLYIISAGFTDPSASQFLRGQVIAVDAL